MFILAIFSVFATFSSTCGRLFLKATTKGPIKKLNYCFQLLSPLNYEDIIPGKFDVDSDTMVIDNLANCIIWKNKTAFNPSTYVRLDSKKAVAAVNTATGEGLPVGIGDVTVGWYDDDGTYHNYVLKGVFHVPDAPVNILGISSFSKIIGDYQNKGTQKNSSGQDSIFTWDNGRFTRTFVHSVSNMPAMLINDGFSKFFKFCNFIDAHTTHRKQCFQVQSRSKRNTILNQPLYDIGEEIVFKNGDHVEKGVIEKVSPDLLGFQAKYEVKFRDNRKVIATVDMLQAQDETDVASIPVKAKEFVEHAKYLTEDEIQQIKAPTKLTPLQIEWKQIHNMYGHM